MKFVLFTEPDCS